MLIEIAGLPGSGKTTLYNALSHELKRRKIEFTDVNTIATERSGAQSGPRFVRRKPYRDLLFRLTRFTTLHPEFFYKAEKTFGDKTIKKFLFFLLSANFQMGKDLKANDELVFLDEGFLTHSVAIFPDKSHSSNLTDLLEHAPEIDVIVFLDTPANIAFERVLERGGPSDKRARKSEKFGDENAFLERCENLKTGFEVYKGRCRFMLRVDTTTSLDDAVTKLAEDLISLNTARSI